MPCCRAAARFGPRSSDSLRLPISLIAYPNHDYGSSGKGVLLGGYSWETYAYEFSALPPEELLPLLHAIAPFADAVTTDPTPLALVS